MGFNDNSPTDDWDDWGATEDVTPQSSDTGDNSSWNDFGSTDSNDSWNDFGSNDNSSTDSWNDFGDNNSGGNDDFGTQNQDSWDNWGTEQQTVDDSQSGGFIDQSDNWGTQPQNESFDDYNNSSPIQESIPVKFNLSSKKAAFVIAGVIIVAAIFLMLVDKIHIDKKPTVDNVQEQEYEEPNYNDNTQQQQQPEQQPQPQPQVNTSEGSVTLVEIPSDTSLNYSGDVLEANGTVVSKTKYVQGHQVLYCVEIKLVFGSSSEVINYYCNYASYNAVSNGDIVVVSYQQVEDNYISVNAISK